MIGHFFEEAAKMGRVVKSKFIGNLLILLLGEIDQSFCLQGQTLQNNLLGGLLVVNGKKIGQCFGRFKEQVGIVADLALGF